MANPVDVVIQGQALDSLGFQTNNMVPSGLALITFGFLVGCDEIWATSDNPITTTWVGCSLAVSNVEVCTDDE